MLKFIIIVIVIIIIVTLKLLHERGFSKLKCSRAKNSENLNMPKWNWKHWVNENWCFYLWINFVIQSSPFSFSSYWIFNLVKKEQLCLDLPGQLKNHSRSSHVWFRLFYFIYQKQNFNKRKNLNLSVSTKVLRSSILKVLRLSSNRRWKNTRL